MQESQDIKICNCNIPPKIQQEKMLDAIAKYIEGIPAKE